ncbi:MAG: lysophospholipid acyltransferase family protein [Lachnospiraceae bacterium]
MFRLILVALALIIYFVITLPFMLILLVVKLFNPKLAARIGQPIVCGFGFRFIMFASGCKCKVIGRENIPKDTPVLFTANHRSFFDIPLAYMSIPVTHLTGFVSKKEVKKVPFLNWWMMILNCIFIDRSNPKAGLQSIKDAIAHVEDGWSIFIMPAGTRSSEPGVLEFKSGSFKIAERTGCPVIPVAICHTDEVFENQFPKIKSQKLTIEFGKPIITEGLSREEFRNIPAKAYEQVCEMYNRNN